MMDDYLELLKSLIATPSVSREEEKAAEILREFLHSKNVNFRTKFNNTWANNLHFDKSKPTILLNSHIDTVKPAQGWIGNPYQPLEDGDKITGLGSNDAGGSLVSLLAAFLFFYHRADLPFNLVYSATAEEEISGERGITCILDALPDIDFALVGEPTSMELAIAEKGLMVIDCHAIGKAGHAAREEGINALYMALDDIEILRKYKFSKVSELLGPVKLTVTQIQAGTQHNVIPDSCHFVLDVRTNEFYHNEEVFNIISGLIKSDVKARSFRLNSSSLSMDHPLIRRASEMDISLYGSPTTSDQAVIPWPSVKMGPGDSARSHTANEYILKSEILYGIRQYCRILEGLYL
jgi:acetylornithine deacetylase